MQSEFNSQRLPCGYPGGVIIQGRLFDLHWRNPEQILFERARAIDDRNPADVWIKNQNSAFAAQ